VELERLAYDAALRALDKQEALLDELRGRTGILLAASALAASFLGDSAVREPNVLLAAVALGAFVLTIAASVFILVPRRTWSDSGAPTTPSYVRYPAPSGSRPARSSSRSSPSSPWSAIPFCERWPTVRHHRRRRPPRPTSSSPRRVAATARSSNNWWRAASLTAGEPRVWRPAAWKTS